jgi:hypothetical protein
MRILFSLIALACLCLPSQAQEFKITGQWVKPPMAQVVPGITAKCDGEYAVPPAWRAGYAGVLPPGVLPPTMPVPTTSPYSDFRPCKADELPYGPDAPPANPLRGDLENVRTGYRFQWQINPKTGELLYRNLGKHNIKLTVRLSDGREFPAADFDNGVRVATSKDTSYLQGQVIVPAPVVPVPVIVTPVAPVVVAPVPVVIQPHVVNFPGFTIVRPNGVTVIVPPITRVRYGFLRWATVPTPPVLVVPVVPK